MQWEKGVYLYNINSEILAQALSMATFVVCSIVLISRHSQIARKPKTKKGKRYLGRWGFPPVFPLSFDFAPNCVEGIFLSGCPAAPNASFCVFLVTMVHTRMLDLSTISQPAELVAYVRYVYITRWETARLFSFIKLLIRAQRLINLEIPVLVRSLKSSNVELG